MEQHHVKMALCGRGLGQIIMEWRIWYKDNVVYDGADTDDWAALPDDGVIGIAVRFGPNENAIMLGELISGSDWYWIYDGKIYQSGTSSDTPGEWLPHAAPEGAVLKKGRWTSEADLAAIDAAMIEWVK